MQTATAPAFTPPWSPADWPGSGKLFCLDLTTVAAAVPVARLKAWDVLAEWEVSGEHAQTARLLISELVTNAVLFGAPSGVHLPAQIALALWRLSGALVIEVGDQSADLPVLRTADNGAEGGRGLHLAAELSGRWGRYVPQPGWKTVYCVLDVSPRLDRGGTTPRRI
jgi:anti-sigma regulatory factor (Ser/Thr protein kinase)